VLCAFDNGKNFRHFWSRPEVDRNVLFDFFLRQQQSCSTDAQRDSFAFYCMCTYSAHKNGHEAKD
jgi:hypothetical protein